MSEKSKISPTDTYVFDDDTLAEMDDTGLTGIVKGLSEYMSEYMGDTEDVPPGDREDNGSTNT